MKNNGELVKWSLILKHINQKDQWKTMLGHFNIHSNIWKGVWTTFDELLKLSKSLDRIFRREFARYIRNVLGVKLTFTRNQRTRAFA